MRSKTSRVPVRIAALATAILAAAVLAACGSSDDGGGATAADSGPQRLGFTLDKTGKLSGPKRAEAGLSELALDNRFRAEANLQLVRVKGKHSTDEVLDGVKKARAEEPVPAWFFVGGGVGEVQPGKSAQVEQVLAPGSYFALDTEGEGPPAHKVVVSFEVTGKPSGEELAAANGKVAATEYSFKTTGLHAGPGKILFENAGKEPHNLIVSEVLKGNDVKDVKRYFNNGGGLAPLSSEIHRVTAVIEGGESQVIPFDFKAGTYVFMCFVSDRKGGKQHAFKGMIDEVTLKEPPRKAG